MGKEYELKFRSNPEIQEEILQNYPGETVKYAMETTYYDTLDGAVSSRRYMLRRRMENGRSVCTLKTPGTGLERGEWETEAESVESAVSELCKLGAPADLVQLVKSGLTATCGARFTRTARTLVLPGGTVELACDRGVLTGGGREMPLCEVEVELKSGSKTAADAFGAELQEKYGLKTEPESKFCRAFALYKGE